MSLIIDSLKKIKSSSPSSSKASVPPSLLNLAPQKGAKKPSTALIVLLVVALLGFAVIFFMPTNDSGNYKVTAPPKKIETPNQQPQQSSNPDPLPVQTENEPNLMAQKQNKVPSGPPDFTNKTEPLPLPEGEFDPTAANMKRLDNMKSLPELGANGGQNQPKSKPAPKDALGIIAEAGIAPVKLAEKPVEQVPVKQSQQPVRQQYNTTFIQMPVIESTANRKAKAEYDSRISYNTKASQAASALAKGDNKKAEMLYNDLMAIKPTKEGLNNLLTAMIRQGKVSELEHVVKKYPSVSDSSIVSNAAIEMNKYGMSLQALEFLSKFSGISGSGQIFYAAGVIQEQTGNLSRAESAYDKALDTSPTDPFFLYAAARNKDMQKKYTQALELYAKLANVPASADIKNNAKSRYEAISEYLEKMKEIDEGNQKAQ